MKKELVCPFSRYQIVIRLVQQFFMKPEVFPYQPFYAISYGSLTHFATDGYT